jgi:hypothetical protein
MIIHLVSSPRRRLGPVKDAEKAQDRHCSDKYHEEQWTDCLQRTAALSYDFQRQPSQARHCHEPCQDAKRRHAAAEAQSDGAGEHDDPDEENVIATRFQRVPYAGWRRMIWIRHDRDHQRDETGNQTADGHDHASRRYYSINDA